MSRYHQSILIVVLTLFAKLALASSTVAPPLPEDQLKKSNVGAYLGIRVDLLPKELIAQLPEDILIGEGILVTGFMPDSPAPQQGIKRFDILLKYNQTALKHPRQLGWLIKKDKIGNTVNFTLLRQGKIITLAVKIGSQNYALDEDQLDYQFNLQVLGYHGYTIKMPSKYYFEATIRYLAPDGIVRRRTFKGPYNLVMREIQTAPDLSKFAKQKLMSVITEKKDDEEGWFGDWMPFSDGIFDF